MPPLHNRFDLARWTREFSIEVVRARARARVEEYAKAPNSWYKNERDKHEHAELLVTDVDMVFGPLQLAVLEQLRAEKAGQVDRGRAVPTDVCVWGLGEPSNPAATKIGGRPYRPADQAWPTNKRGEPLGLLAQFCFLDSLDVLPVAKEQLPGDLLLVFTNGSHLYCDWHPDDDDGNWKLEWQSIDAVRGNVVAAAPRILDVTPVYAELHRTVDYPESTIYDGLDVIVGSKLGGVPAFQQDEPGIAGSHLCSLGSLHPFGGPWPLVNVPTNPNGNDKHLDHKLLMLGDVGAAYFFLDENGQIRWHADCG